MAKGKMSAATKKALAAARAGARKGGRKARSNYRRSRGTNWKSEIFDALGAFGGGGLYPLAVNIAMKFFPVSADGTGSLSPAVVGAIVAVVLHIGGQFALGSRSFGHGAIGAYAATLNLPKLLGINDALKIRDYVSDYVSDRQIGAQQIDIVGGARRFPVRELGDDMGDQIGRRHRRHYAGHHLNDGGNYGTAYGASYGS